MLQRVKAPVLVIHGNKDIRVPWSDALLWIQELSRTNDSNMGTDLFSDLDPYGLRCTDNANVAVHVFGKFNVQAIRCPTRDVQAHVLADLNHVLRRDVGAPDLPEQYRLANRIDPRVISILTDWVAQQVQRR